MFWKGENRQAIDSYDNSECNSECQEKGHTDFIWIQDSILSVPSAANLFEYEHFHENLKWTVVVCARKPGMV